MLVPLQKLKSKLLEPPFYFTDKLPLEYGETEASDILYDYINEFANRVQPQKHLDNYWFPLVVDTKTNPERTHGVGLNSFHMDYINREFPPDFITFLCVRPDPMGGGTTYLSNISDAISVLNEREKEILKLPIFKYWKDEGTINLGENLSKFSILPNDNNFICRFSAKMLKHFNGSSDILDEAYLFLTGEIHFAFKKLIDKLFENRIEIHLEKNQFVVFNQKRLLHARQELGENQKKIEISKRRRILQGYAFLKEASTE